jgi:hypothetical protein
MVCKILCLLDCIRAQKYRESRWQDDLKIPQEKVHDFPENCPRLKVSNFDEEVAREDFKHQC